MPTLENGPVIELPADGNRRKLLRSLLRQMLKGHRKYYYKAPEIPAMARILYSIEILQLLFKEGRVTTRELSERIVAEYGSSYQPREYEAACFVVDDYCRTGGKHIVFRDHYI